MGYSFGKTTIRTDLTVLFSPYDLEGELYYYAGQTIPENTEGGIPGVFITLGIVRWF